jgi:predicted GH43/DUF377 family glycosyl hydrolase
MALTRKVATGFKVTRGEKTQKPARKSGLPRKTEKSLERPSHALRKFVGNPIIQPNAENEWETKATFNPAAVYEGGKIHILYRAIGDTDMSVLGYASTKDGFIIDERLSKPAYVPREPFEGVSAKREGLTSMGYFISGGGGWGGCEDPRLTKIGARVYMTYVAFNGGPPRVALTSIKVADFLKKNWKWVRPILISQPPEMLRKNPKFKDIVDKNACILPEKINGKYVIFHRIYPDILVDFVDDLEFKDSYLQGEYKISPRPGYWDSRKVGAGAPPIKTKYGWLLIYQGVGEEDSSRYKIGAMMLDLKNPAKVIARSKKPVLEPDQEYENAGWKFGIVYPCGAVVVDNQLLVYYGGADTVVCVAVAELDEFVEKLMTDKEPKLGRKTRLKKSS